MDINIKTIDTVVETGKEFLQKVVVPPLEQIGLLLADKVKFWRLKNQLNILLKADEFLKAHNIMTQKASLKILTPLLEDCSLEEDLGLQEKWAALLTNIVREKSLVNTNVFGYILSQLTTEEATIFDRIIEIVIKKSKQNFSSSATLFSYRDIQPDTIRINQENIFNELENLIRLRLIKEIETPDANIMSYQVTMLGMSFYSACQFKK